MTLARGFTLAAAETEITRRLLAGERVLLVGAAKTNLPTQLADHPQVQLWDSEGARARMVPANARVVLFTKWVGHNQHRTIREDAARDKNRFVWPELLGTGEIRRLLQPLIISPTNEPVEELLDLAGRRIEPQPMCFCGQVEGAKWGGSVRDFVEKHWEVNVEHTFGWQVREAKRLHLLAGQHGLTTTVTYVEKIVSVLNIERVRERDEQKLSEERAQLAREAVANERAEQQLRHAVDLLPAMPKPVEVPAVVVAAAVVATPQDDMAELLRMIDDAQAVLGLARETIVRLAKENSEQRNVRDRLRAKMQAALDAV